MKKFYLPLLGSFISFVLTIVSIKQLSPYAIKSLDSIVSDLFKLIDTDINLIFFLSIFAPIVSIVISGWILFDLYSRYSEGLPYTALKKTALIGWASLLVINILISLYYVLFLVLFIIIAVSVILAMANGSYSGGGGSVYVRGHYRRGGYVRGHYRRRPWR